MARSKKSIWVFFVSAGISFIVFGTVFVIFFYITDATKIDKNQEGIPYISQYVPSPKESINVLVVGCEQENYPPSFEMLFCYDAPNGIIYVSSFPIQSISTVGIREDTLEGHYDYQGLQGSVIATENLLSIPIDRYVRLNKEGVSNLVDFFGGIDYELTEDLAVGEETFVKGKQLLDGRRVSTLLFQKKEKDVYHTSLQEELITKLIQQRFNQSLADKYAKFSSAFFYNTETNLNQYDFALRQKGICSKMQLDSVVVKKLPIRGNYTQEKTKFTPTEQSLNEVKTVLQAIKREQQPSS
ncbi:LCP family protein [Paludicola sp. MB14-C6]|uniref:LCP family protein n=1 Tax=Paludihabitans sp. MB14-C6 TaxID=3070656 RepID=UPI0027DC98D3|nr:LCP family protein [Paludicola sp. MB14-C6]WMJ22060.1 LCP family protein [Paludicola sp. MB14-C6]